MLDLKSSSILVTGGMGFIGSHLIEELLKFHPATLICIDRGNNPKSYFNSRYLAEKIIFVDCDIKSFKRVFDAITKYNIDVVFHIAAQAIVETAYKNPLETFESNIMGTANVLEACRLKGGVKAVVVASSDKAYGKTEKLPYNEQTPLNGNHPYDASKSATDLIAQTYFKTYGIPVAISRFCNVFGPGDLNFNRIVPGVLTSIIKNEKFLIRSDGKMRREYIYVKDVVDGYVKLAQNIDNIKGNAFNFGTKNIFSVINVIHRIEQILNIKVNYEILNIAKNEIPEQYLDWEKARKTLDWESKITFEEGIKEAFNWYKDFYNT